MKRLVLVNLIFSGLLVSCSGGMSDEFLDGSWVDSYGTVYTFDCEGDDGYNPVILEMSRGNLRFGKYKISGNTVTWDLEEDGSTDGKFSRNGDLLENKFMTLKRRD